MKTFVKFFLLFFTTALLYNCNTPNNNQTEQRLADTIIQQVIIDSLSTQQKSVDLIDTTPKLAGHTIEFYLSHKQIPQACKDIFNKKRKATDDNESFALIDSIFTNNKETQPFYFLTLTQTMKKADGAYAEPLGIMGKQFVENHTKQFLDYFINEPMLTDDYFYEWVETVAGEISIMAEKHKKEELINVKNKMTQNCKVCDELQFEKLNDFIKKINKHKYIN